MPQDPSASQSEVKDDDNIGRPMNDYPGMQQVEYDSRVFTQIFRDGVSLEELNIDENIKLHISLSQEEYEFHKENIKKIIINHIQQGTLKTFKTVDYAAIDENIELISKARDEWSQYKESAETSFEAVKKYPNLFKKLKNANPAMSSLPVKWTQSYLEVDSYFNDFDGVIESLVRFRKGDQFTLYIPKGYSKRKIKDLCIEIDNYMIKRKITPSDKSDVALNITPHINARLEYFASGDDRERIHAIPDSDELPERRQRAREELEKDTLFKHLLSLRLLDNPMIKPVVEKIQAEIVRFEKASESKLGIGNGKKALNIQDALDRATNYCNNNYSTITPAALLDYKEQCNLYIISIKKIERIDIVTLDKAKTENTPILIKTNNGYVIYGDKKGDGKWDYTNISSENHFGALDFKDQTLNKIEHTNTKLYTNALMKALLKGHASKLSLREALGLHRKGFFGKPASLKNVEALFANKDSGSSIKNYIFKSVGW